jgi:hypothetical protein
LFTKPDGSVVETILSREFFGGDITVLEAPRGTCVTYTLALNPPTAFNMTGSTHTVTATLTANKKPLAGQNILFSVSGANTASGSGVSDGSGNASFSYIGTNAGTDTITACADINKNGVCDPEEPTATATKTWEAPIIATGTTFSATEGASFSGTVATFTDPDPASTAGEYSASIAWGDGSSSAGTITGPTGGPFTVSGGHTYADEGTYTVTVMISDVDTPSNTATATSTANVADAALTAGGLVLSDGVEGVSPTTATFSFTDANAGASSADFTATITWGDSSTSPGLVSGGGGSFVVSGSHTYAEEGSYPVSVSVVDDGGSTTAANGTAQPVDAPLAASCATSATSPQAFNGSVASFSDANPGGTLSDFSASIDWGDSSSSVGTVSGSGPFTVSGSHTYSSTGVFTITTSITDVGGSKAKVACSVLIFAFAPGGGAFVIGDLNSKNGTDVTFWGAQWWKLNDLSGGSAPASFKGFAEDPATPKCGTGWTTDPGNSTPPPSGALPAYMAVIVSSSISKSGSTISGNTHIVVVKTNAGYAPNPGHAGTGTVVAQVC